MKFAEEKCHWLVSSLRLDFLKANCSRQRLQTVCQCHSLGFTVTSPLLASLQTHEYKWVPVLVGKVTCDGLAFHAGRNGNTLRSFHAKEARNKRGPEAPTWLRTDKFPTVLVLNTQPTKELKFVLNIYVRTHEQKDRQALSLECLLVCRLYCS